MGSRSSHARCERGWHTAVPRGDGRRCGHLSLREREVLALVAEGQTNREIGRAPKLGASSRPPAVTEQQAG